VAEATVEGAGDGQGPAAGDAQAPAGTAPAAEAEPETSEGASSEAGETDTPPMAGDAQRGDSAGDEQA